MKCAGKQPYFCYNHKIEKELAICSNVHYENSLATEDTTAPTRALLFYCRSLPKDSASIRKYW